MLIISYLLDKRLCPFWKKYIQDNAFKMGLQFLKENNHIYKKENWK